MAGMPTTERYQPRVPRNLAQHRVRRIDYQVHTWGDANAPLMVYLHGWADSGATFQFVVDALESDWFVVAPDWRGFGLTPCECTSYWFPDYVADLHDLLEIYSPGTPVRLVGHSMGGNVASLYAGVMPERVLALVNIEGFGLIDSDPANAPQRYREWLDASRSGPSFSTYSDFDALATRLYRRYPGISMGQAAFVAEQWARKADDGTIVLRADPIHKLPNPVLYRRREAEACWSAATAEVLLISGAKSDAARWSGDVATLTHPRLQSVQLDEAGHMPHFEAPGPLAAEIEAFFRSTL